MVYFLLADGFEETEAVAPFDIVKRAGLNAVYASVSESLTVIGSHGIKIVADIFMKDISPENAEMIVLPGGKSGVENLDVTIGFDDLVGKLAKQGCYICAICAAPSLLGKRGYLYGKKAVCYPEPEFEQHLKNAHIQNERVVKDGQYITAIGAGASIEFGLKLVETLKNKEIADKIKNGIK